MKSYLVSDLLMVSCQGARLLLQSTATGLAVPSETARNTTGQRKEHRGAEAGMSRGRDLPFNPWPAGWSTGGDLPGQGYSGGQGYPSGQGHSSGQGHPGGSISTRAGRCSHRMCQTPAKSLSCTVVSFFKPITVRCKMKLLPFEESICSYQPLGSPPQHQQAAGTHCPASRQPQHS